MKNELQTASDVPVESGDLFSLRCGHYANGLGAWMDVEVIVMPGYPDYDGGLPGVSVKWGNKSWFVPARDAEDFWSQFPYEILRGKFISENDQEHPASEL